MTLLAPRPTGPEPGGEHLAPGGLLDPPAGHRLVTYRPASLAGLPLRIGRAFAAGRPLQNALFTSPDLVGKLAQLVGEADRTVVLLTRLADAYGQLEGRAWGLDLIDSLSLNMERRAAREPFMLRPFLRREARRTVRAEAAALASCRGALVVSERDRRHLLDAVAGAPAEARTGEERAAEKLVALPLDFAAGEGAAALRETPATEGPGPVVFTGNLGYFVNADAAAWLLGSVWPRVRRARPDARLVIAGARPPRALVRSARRGAGDGVSLYPSPPSLEPFLASASVVVAPMRAGSGQPLKVMEAWRAGKAVVATPWAAAGTTGEPGRDLEVAGGDLEAPDAAGFAAAVVALLEDPDRRRRLGEAGRLRLAEDYAFEPLRRRYLEWLDGLG